MTYNLSMWESQAIGRLLANPPWREGGTDGIATFDMILLMYQQSELYRRHSVEPDRQLHLVLSDLPHDVLVREVEKRSSWAATALREARLRRPHIDGTTMTLLRQSGLVC